MNKAVGVALLRRAAARLAAFGRYREKPLHVLLADDVRMRAATGALRDQRGLRCREIVLRMIGEHDVGAGTRRQVAEALCGLRVSIEPETGGTLRGNVRSGAAHPVERRAAPVGSHVGGAAVL